MLQLHITMLHTYINIYAVKENALTSAYLSDRFVCACVVIHTYIHGCIHTYAVRESALTSAYLSNWFLVPV